MIIYISGKIMGKLDYLQSFDKAEKEVKALGHVVINPNIMPLGLSWEKYMVVDLAMVDVSDGILMLDGWQDSRGARKELERAVEGNKQIYRYDANGEIIEFKDVRLILEEAGKVAKKEHGQSGHN